MPADYSPDYLIAVLGTKQAARLGGQLVAAAGKGGGRSLWELSNLGALSALQGGFFESATRVLRYSGNALSPTTLPSPADIWQLYWADRLGDGHVLYWLRQHGIDWNGDPPGRDNAAPTVNDLWRKVAELNRPYAPFDLLKEWWLRSDRPDTGFPFGRDRLNDLLTRQGIINPFEQATYLDLPNAPPVELLIALWRQGALSRDYVERWLTRLGWLDEATRGLFFTETQIPGPGTVADLLNRGLIPIDAARSLLQAAGFTDDAIKDYLLSLRFDIPSYVEAIRQQTALAWDDDFAARWGLDRRFPLGLASYWQAQGRWYGAEKPLPDQPGQSAPDLPLADWRSHWFLPSLQQAMRLYQFVRPDNVERWNVVRWPDGSRPFQDLKPFTPEQLADSAAASGVAPEAVLQMQASGITPLSRRDLYQGVRLGILPTERVVGSYLDQGMTPDDAALATQIQQVRAEEARLRPFESMLSRLKNQYAKAWIDTYHKGGATRDEALSALSGLGYPLDLAAAILDLHAPAEHATFAARQTQRALAAGVRAALRLYRLGVAADGETLVTLEEMGIAPQAAALLVSDEKMAMRAQVAQAGIASVRRDFRAGLFSRSQAADRLTTFGILPQAASTYVAMWQAGQSDTRRRLQTGEVMRLVKEGLLSVADGKKRLQNLGWDKADLDLLAREMQYNVYKAGAATSKAAKAAAAAATAVGGTPPAPPPGSGGG